MCVLDVIKIDSLYLENRKKITQVEHVSFNLTLFIIMKQTSLQIIIHITENIILFILEEFTDGQSCGDLQPIHQLEHLSSYSPPRDAFPVSKT